MELRCDGVTKAFDQRVVLSSVTFNVNEGEVVAIVGGNGAGKSTLLNICAGVLNADSGHVWIGTHEVASGIEFTNHFAFVPERVAAYRDLTAVENIQFFDELAAGRRDASLYRDTLSRVGFPVELADSPFRTYSKGMRQKVVLALGLLKGAAVFLLDEPSSGLEPASIAELAVTLRSLAHEHRKTILFVSHDLQFVNACADRIGILQSGVMMSMGSPRDVHNDIARFSGDPL